MLSCDLNTFFFYSLAQILLRNVLRLFSLTSWYSSRFFVSAVKRLMREAKELSEATSDYYAQPLSDNLFEWHFTVGSRHNVTFLDNLSFIADSDLILY